MTVEDCKESEEFTEKDPLKEKTDIEEKRQKRTFKQSCVYVLKNTTVEPTMIFFVIPAIMTILISQNLGLEKACRVNLNFSKEICDSLKLQSIEGQSQYERDVQKLITKAMAWKTYITATVPCLIALFVGSWSDRTGYRKIFILLPVFGQTLVCVNGIIQTYFFHQLSLEHFIFIEAIIEGFSGYWCICVLIIFAYISSITTDRERTFRMGLINFSMTVGFPIGMLLAGVLLKKLGYYGCYGLAGSLHLLNFFYNAFLLKDPEKTTEQKKVPIKESGRIGEECAESKPLKENVQEQKKTKFEMTDTDYKEDGGNMEEFTESDSLKGKKGTEQKLTVKETCLYVLKNITVEPTMFFFVIPGVISILTSQNLGLEKACRVNLNFTDEICDSLKMQSIEGQNEYERDVQKLITRAMAWKTYITATVPCILALFVGSWSDRTGYRKLFIIYPLMGQVLTCLNGILHTYFFKQLSLEYLVFSEGIIEGFSGYWCVLFMTVFAYISAITTDKERTFRMGLINFSMTVGFPVGMGMSGIMLKRLGYYGSYGISGVLHLMNLFYNIFVLKDPQKTADQVENTSKGAGHLIRSFFDLTNIKETIGVVFRNGPNHRRVRMIVMMAVTSILFGPLHGELSILYISTRYRFSWDEVKFSLFQTYNFIAHTIGTIFSITYFSKHLQWHDSVLGIISTVSKISASFIYCFAPNERIFFIAPLVDILNGTSLLAMRSITSKLVATNELGKVNSIFALTENLMPLIYIPLYTKVYAATMEVLPGAPFLMGAAMTVPAVIVFIYLFYEHRKQVMKQKQSPVGS